MLSNIFQRPRELLHRENTHHKLENAARIPNIPIKMYPSSVAQELGVWAPGLASLFTDYLCLTFVIRNLGILIDYIKLQVSHV